MPPAASLFLSSAMDMAKNLIGMKRMLSENTNIQQDTLKKSAETAHALADAEKKGAEVKGLSMQNFMLARQLELERVHPKFWAFLDALRGRLGFLSPAAMAGSAAKYILKN